MAVCVPRTLKSNDGHLPSPSNVQRHCSDLLKVHNFFAEEPNGEEIEATLEQLSDEEKEEACGNG